MMKKISIMSHFKNISLPHYGGIFDSSAEDKLSWREIPDFERARIGNFNRRHTLGIPRIEISDQHRDRLKWGVLKLALLFILCCMLPVPLFADYVDDKLPDDTSVQIKNGARQIIELGIKNRHAVKLTKRMISEKFSQDQILAAYDVLITVKEQNLSEEPIMDKLNEGIAKEVRPDSIILAMEKVRLRYETARDCARILSADEDHVQTMTEEIAECMTAGIDANDIRKVAETLKGKAEAMSKRKAETLNKRSIRIMKTMGRSGVESQYALGIVESAFENGYTTNAMGDLENSFKLNARWTASVSDLAKAYIAAIEDGATFDDVDFYDPWTTSLGARISGGFGHRMPGRGIPPGGPAGGVIPRGRPIGGSPSALPIAPASPRGNPNGLTPEAPPGN